MKLMQGLAGGMLGMVGGLLVMFLALDLLIGSDPAAETGAAASAQTIRVAIPEGAFAG